MTQKKASSVNKRSKRKGKKKSSGTRAVSIPFVNRWGKAWKRAPLRRRLTMVATLIVTVACVIALVTGVTMFAYWRHTISIVRAAQEETEQLYGFNPGEIISDDQFFDSDALTEDEVQDFLEEQGSALASLTFDTEDMDSDDMCAAYEGADNESAAAIIDKSARACGISQKVLLTMLQKEQQLITSTDPTDFQLRAAMGLSCPDDASCDPEYDGFFRQVYGAAHRYQYYLAHEDEYNYHAGKLNYVAYNPDSSCGGSDVYIENDATALLYIYTPYQPNIAALEAGSGEGNECSAYGNRNFSLIYTGWFGDPRQ